MKTAHGPLILVLVLLSATAFSALFQVGQTDQTTRNHCDQL